MKTYTSRSRFDETRRFTGVYQQMGRVALDADHNEQVRLALTDRRRRSADLAEGSPDDGFLITDDWLLDPIRSTAGWIGEQPGAADDRIIDPELTLDRRDPATLPFVIRSRGHIALRRTLPAPIDLARFPLVHPEARPEFDERIALDTLAFNLRFERPPTDDEIRDLRLQFRDRDGVWHVVEAVDADGAEIAAPFGWTTVYVAVAELRGRPGWAVDPSTGQPSFEITGWGLFDLRPRARVWVDGLRGRGALIDDADFVIRGGDRTLHGAGRLFVAGRRAFLEADQRYRNQPDFPDAPSVSLPAADRSHIVYLDVWEQTVTALDDPFLVEPALDGLDTTTRQRLVTQVRVATDLVDEAGALPRRTGGSRLSTNVPAAALPDRYALTDPDACRDRCLFTENASAGVGYRGHDNLHVRVELFPIAGRLAVLWARDNASTVVPLVANAPGGSTSVQVASVDARLFRAGDLVVIEDRRTRLWLEGPHQPVLRRLLAVNEANGTLTFEAPGHLLNAATAPADGIGLDVGGALPESFAVADVAAVRRWDGGDLLVDTARYNLRDGVVFAISGAEHRAGDYWSFTARIHAPDGAARGVVEQLDAAPVHGPIHHHMPLARVRLEDGVRVFDDLRPRFLPLNAVRDRLIELDRPERTPGAFTLVIGDGERTFGDIDQNLLEGVTGDEAIQAALRLMEGAGGTIYLRAGVYQLEHPVLLRGLSNLRILGDGDGTELQVRGGAFWLDACGRAGRIGIELLKLVEDPEVPVQIGELAIVGDALAVEGPIEGDAFAVLGPEDVIRRRAPRDVFFRGLAEVLPRLGRGAGRVADQVAGTLAELRRIQRRAPGTPLADNPEAQPLLEALQAVPHGLISVADSEQVEIRRCSIQQRAPGDRAYGIFVTGTCRDVTARENRVEAATGVVVEAFAPYFARALLARHPKAGLFARDLRIEGNVIEASGRATHGVRVAEGRFDGVVIHGNRVHGFPIGIEVLDRAELRGTRPTDRVLVSDNQVFDSAAVGLLIDADQVDVSRNEVRNAESSGLLQAGILVSGRGIRVSDCWITVPRVASELVLASAAGIVIGEGLDDEDGRPKPISDIEVRANRIDGQGAGSAAAGILLAGPAPAYDVRISENVIRELGDAGVRLAQAGGPVGRLRVEGNRIEGVAQRATPGRIPAETLEAQVRRLNGRIASNLRADVTTPRALLAALLADDRPDVRAPLDAALRWVERVATNGGVVLGGPEGAEVVHNRISQVGHAVADFADLDGDARQIAAVSAVGGFDVIVDGNHLTEVRAPLRQIPVEIVPPINEAARLYELLDALGLDPTVDATERQSLHKAASGLRRLLVDYAVGNAVVRTQLGRRIYGPLDAMVRSVAVLGELGERLGQQLRDDIDEMRSAQGYAAHTVAAQFARRTVTQIALHSTLDEATKAAWDAAYELDLALTRGPEAVPPALDRLRELAESLLEGLPEAAVRLEQLRALLARIERNPPEEQVRASFELVRWLGTLARLRDALGRRAGLDDRDELAGDRLTIVRAFADRLLEETGRLGGIGADNLRLDLIRALRPSNNVLFSTLVRAEPQLARDLEADYQSVERTGGRVQPTLDRLRNTLSRVRARFGEDGAGDIPGAADDEREQATEQAAMVHLFANHLDDQFLGLRTETDAGLEKRMRTLQTTTGQLRSLVADDPELDEIVGRAQAELEGVGGDRAARERALGVVQAQFKAVRFRVGKLLPRDLFNPPKVVPEAESFAPRVAGLGALAVLLLDLEPAGFDDLFARTRRHLDRVLVEQQLDGPGRAASLATVDKAEESLSRNSSAAVRIGVARRLLSEFEQIATHRRAGVTPSDTLMTVVALLRIARLALGGGDVALDEARAEARAQADHLAPQVVAALDRRIEVDDLIEDVADLFERILSEETPRTIARRVPIYPTRPEPAEGVFLAAVDQRLRVVDNQVEAALTGLTVAGDHLLAPTREGAAPLIEVTGNRLGGCALRGLVVQPTGRAMATLSGNQILACAGLAGPGVDGHAQAAAHLGGEGDLVVQGNLFQGNGNEHPDAVFHEIVVDWRGEAVFRGNTIRHTSGDEGGAGLMILVEPLAPRTAESLARAPFLSIEAPPKPKTEPTPRPFLPFFPIDLTRLAPSLAIGERLELGALRVKQPTKTILHRALVKAPPPPRSAGTPARLAGRYADLALRAGRLSLIELVNPTRWLPQIQFRPIPQHRSVHLEGNDIQARGPALLLLGAGRDIVSATVVGNTLVSERRTGAVYLRRMDATVFSGNRCECLDTINVVVIRADKAPVTASNNVIVGREPVVPPRKPPTPKPPKKPSGVQLDVPLGLGASLKVPIDAFKLHGAVQRHKLDAAQAFSRVFTALDLQPDAGDGNLDGNPDGNLGANVNVRLNPDRLLRSQAFYHVANAAEAGRESNVKRMVDLLIAHGVQPEETGAHVRALMVASNNDPADAAQRLERDLLGVDTATPAVRESLAKGSLVSDVIADAIFKAKDLLLPGSADATDEVEEAAPAPKRETAFQKSLVVLGGSRVAVVANATTAGVFLEGADSTVELNA